MPPSAPVRTMGCFFAALACAAGIVTPSAQGAVHIKDRTINEPIVLDQPEDYFLHKVYISGITDLSALTLTGKINSVTLTHCVFTNIWAGMNNKAVAAESQGAIVGSFAATDSAFEDAQHQLLCLREGAFGTVTFTRCRFKTSDQFLKRIYAEDPWRNAPPTTEFANIDRLELIDNEYSNTILVIHPSVKLVIFRGDLSNVRLQSPATHVIRLERNQDPASISYDGTAMASTLPVAPVIPGAVTVIPMRPEIFEAAARAVAEAQDESTARASDEVAETDEPVSTEPAAASVNLMVAHP